MVRGGGETVHFPYIQLVDASVGLRFCTFRRKSSLDLIVMMVGVSMYDLDIWDILGR